MRLGWRLLIGVVDRHVVGEGKVARDVLDLAIRVGDRRRRAVALVTGFLDCRVTARLRHRSAVRAIAQQAAGAKHRMCVVTVEARSLPHLRVGRKLALCRRAGRIDLVGNN